jgi:hypothetical protein
MSNNVNIKDLRYAFYYHKVAIFYAYCWYFITYTTRQSLLTSQNCLKNLGGRA